MHFVTLLCCRLWNGNPKLLESSNNDDGDGDENATVQPACAAWKKNKDSSVIKTTANQSDLSMVYFRVLQQTLTLVISRRSFTWDGKEMFKNVKRTREATVLFW